MGVNGKAVSMMSYVSSIMEKEGKTADEINQYRENAMSGDYWNLLCESLDIIDALNQ